MSFGVHLARQFLAPLQGKTVVFFVADRDTNLLLSKLLVTSAAASGNSCFVLDMDAFYASNSNSLAGDVSPQDMKNIQLYIPRIGASGEEAALGLFDGVEHRIDIIDDMNSLYHTFSSDDQGSAGRKLTFLMEVLSFLGRTNRMTVLITIYERERPTFTRRARLFAGLGDVSVSIRRDGDGLTLRCDRGAAWPDRTLNLSIRP